MKRREFLMAALVGPLVPLLPKTELPWPAAKGIYIPKYPKMDRWVNDNDLGKIGQVRKCVGVK